MVLQMTMFCRIEHSSTTLLVVGEHRNNPENFICTFPGKCSKSIYQCRNIISDFLVSDFISDHRALHASMQCIRPLPVRKQIAVRAIKRIRDDAIVKDLVKFSID